MKIKMHANGNVRDCSPDVAEALIDAGLAVALTPKEVVAHNIGSVPHHELNWSAVDGEYVDGQQYAPALRHRCTTCQLITYAHPRNKPAEPKVFHFEMHHCPKEVYETYLRLFDAWKSRDPRRQLKEPYERLLDGVRQRTKDGLDDRKHDPRRGEVVTL